MFLISGCSSARYSSEPGAPTLVVPAHFAEGNGEPAPPPLVVPAAPASAAATSASTAVATKPVPGDSSGPASPPLTPSNLPDPTPLRLAEQVEYELELSAGRVKVLSVKPVKLAAPIVTPRRLGRYAIELSIGHELIERLRFDFPGTAADEPELGSKKRLHAPLTLSERAIARVKLQLPHSPRVRRAALVDRAANTATEIDWPLPVIPKAPPSPAQPEGSLP